MKEMEKLFKPQNSSYYDKGKFAAYCLEADVVVDCFLMPGGVQGVSHSTQYIDVSHI